MSSAIGIDLGSSRSVIGVVQKGGVEVICNESSYRETSSVVGYGSAERLMGEMGKQKMKSNFKNTASFFTRVLNMDFGSPEYQVERKHIFCKTIAGPSNKVNFIVDYQGEQIQLSPEQVLAAHFNNLANIVKMNGMDCREYVVSYPNYFSQQEKESILVAARIAHVKVSRLVSETECNVKNYGIFRRGDIKDTKRTVFFVDFGHSKTSVYIAEFTNQKANVLYENHNRHLGARDIDLLLYDLYQKEFEQQTGHLVDESPKARMRLFEAIERQRKLLSANEDAGCNVEYLVEEDDFSRNLTREQFEKLATPVFDRFNGFIAFCIQESKINLKELHSVEIIGGATRIPMIQAIILANTQVEQVSKTLNAAENCSRGAAVSAAEVSTFFKVVPFAVAVKNQYPVKCKYLVQKDEGVVEKTGTLFKYGAEPPLSMSVTLPKTKQSTFEVLYEDLVPQRSHREIFTLNIHPVNPKQEDFKIIIRTHIDENHQIALKAVELEENFVEEQKKPKEKSKDAAPKKEGEEPAPAEEEFEIVKVKKTHTSNVKFDIIRPVFFSEEQIAAWTKIETDMVKRDTVILDTNKAKNDLETLIYSCKDKVSGEWRHYISEEEVRLISAKQQQLETWINTEGVAAGKDSYTAKVQEMTELIAPVSEREKLHLQFADSIVYLHNKIVHYSQETAEVEKNVSIFQKFKNLVTFKVQFFFLPQQDSNPRPRSTAT